MAAGVPVEARGRVKLARRSVVRGLLVVALLGGALPVLVVAAGADPPAGDWSALRGCESSGRYDVVATNGHFGAYQFDLPTWRSVGGTGFPSTASPAEQDYRALILYRQRGYGFTGTGCYGAKTATAVLDLQRANGITTSGLLGPKTWAAAWTGTAPTRQVPHP